MRAIHSAQKPHYKLHLDGTVTLLSLPVTGGNSQATQALNKLRDAGISIPEWARANGFSVATTKAVLFGHSQCKRGEAHRVAVALGIKSGVCASPHGYPLSSIRPTPAKPRSVPRITGGRAS